jgi:phosphosulfolactate synthase
VAVPSPGARDGAVGSHGQQPGVTGMGLVQERNVGAWSGVVAFPVPGRYPKPRESGITMIFDKGLGLEATRDFLALVGDSVDLLKLAFGTTAFYPEEILRQKIALGRSLGVDVYPGGTFLEVAVCQGRAREFLERCRDLGFSCIEISDGTIQMSARTRYRLLETCLAMGFRVLTEVGKKHPADRVPRSNIREQIAADLANGAWKVIVEGRESGKGVVIYRDDGTIDDDELEGLVECVPDPSRLIWEAPLKNQQQDLILRFGPNVNLGNVHPEDALSVEALRVGLRGDTLRAAILSATMPTGGAWDDPSERRD